MKKTLIAIMALAAGSMAASAMLTDPDWEIDVETPWKDEPWTGTQLSYTYDDGADFLIKSTDNTYKLIGTYVRNSAYGDYIGTESKALAASVSVTISDLTPGTEYDLWIVSGVAADAGGAADGLNGLLIDNEYSSSNYELGAPVINGITHFLIERVIVDDEGTINFTIDKHSENHIATVNYVAIKESPILIPEPATATLSLLALAGLAVRRRRH